jgi:hypothetical protein
MLGAAVPFSRNGVPLRAPNSPWIGSHSMLNVSSRCNSNISPAGAFDRGEILAFATEGQRENRSAPALW